MSIQDYLIESHLVPIDTLGKIADAHAFELWGETIGRGDPIPLSDASDVYAYIFPYIRGARQFPSQETLFAQIRALRSRFKVNSGQDNIPEAYYAELKRIGSGFGSICTASRYTDTPILWMSHFLAPYFIFGGSAKEQAVEKLGAAAKLHTYYYFSSEEQYLKFEVGNNTLLLDACAPERRVPADALTRHVLEPKSEVLISEIRKSWERLTANASPGINTEHINLAIAPIMNVAPMGYKINELSTTHIVKKIANWELIPVVDHTKHNWCVPTSWAMLLGFYDNHVKGKGTFLGYGRLIDYWYELTPGGANLPNLIDDVLPPKNAAAINNYSFPETHTGGDPTKMWNALKAEVDAGRPCFFNLPGHCMVAFGYHIDDSGDKFAIVYDPPNPSVPTFEHESNIQTCVGIGTVKLSGGTDGENLVIIEPDGGEIFHTSVPDEIVWFVWGNSVKKTRVSISQDGGNNWQIVADNIPTKSAWNSYAWIPRDKGTRVRVKIEGLTTGNVLIAADGSFKNVVVKPSANGITWKKIWGPTDFVVASNVMGKPNILIYAVPTSGDGIYQYDGVPMSWTKIGGPGKMFVLDDSGHLYGLSPDNSGIFRYDGMPTKWTQVGGPASALYTGGSSLFATNPQTADIYQYGGKPMTWTKVGGPGKMFTVDAKGRLYGLSPNGSGIFRYDGTPMAWTKIAGQSGAIWSGGCGLYATVGNNNDVFYYSLTPLVWAKIGGPGKMFAVDDVGRIYGLSPDGSGVFRYDGVWNALEKWTKVGGDRRENIRWWKWTTLCHIASDERSHEL